MRFPAQPRARCGFLTVCERSNRVVQQFWDRERGAEYYANWTVDQLLDKVEESVLYAEATLNAEVQQLNQRGIRLMSDVGGPKIHAADYGGKPSHVRSSSPQRGAHVASRTDLSPPWLWSQEPPRARSCVLERRRSARIAPRCAKLRVLPAHRSGQQVWDRRVCSTLSGVDPRWRVRRGDPVGAAVWL